LVAVPVVLHALVRPRPAGTGRLIASGLAALAPLWPGSSTTTFSCAGGAGGVVVVGGATDVVVVVGAVVVVVVVRVVVVGVADGEPPQPASTRRQVTASTGLRTALTLPHGGATTLEPSRREEAMVQPGGVPDMQQILQQAQKMQEQLMSAQEELANAEATGSAGGGLVTAVVSGAGELKSLTIDPKVVDPEDVETLADLVVAAVRDASANAQQLAADAMGPLAGGMGGLGLPGM
jgi:nucleoid-associated protein EbfC